MVLPGFLIQSDSRVSLSTDLEQQKLDVLPSALTHSQNLGSSITA